MPLLAILFCLGAASVAVLGFASAHSDIQLTIGLMGLFFAGLFLELMLQERARSTTSKAVRRLEERLANASPVPRADAASDFNTAVQLYQGEHGGGEAGSAIRELAGFALRQQGYLK